MNSKSNTEYLGSICDDHSNLNTRITAISSLNAKNLRVFEISLLIVEYFQLISQALLLFPSLYQVSGSSDNVLYNGVIFVAKLMHPGFWMIIPGQEALTLTLLICFTLSIILKYLLFLYIFIIVYKNLRGWEPLIILWRFIVKAQGRVLCYFSASLWTYLIIMVTYADYNLLGIGSTELIIWASCMFALEYIISIFLQTRYFNPLPTKNFLSRKDNTLDVITLLQKCIIGILSMSVNLYANGTTWVFTTMNIVFSLIRESYFYSTLPFYKINALFYQAWLLMMVFSVNVACFMSNIVENGDMSFIITTWILLFILTGIASHQYLNKVLLRLLSGKQQGSCLLMIQRIAMIQHLRKLKRPPAEHAVRYDLSLLYNSSAFLKAAEMLESSFDGADIYSKSSMAKIFQEYLRSLTVKFPKDEFLKLYMAYFTAKKLKLFGVAIKDINELKKSNSHKIVVGASLFLYHIQDAVNKLYEDSQSLINLQTYLKSKVLVAKMEGKMLKQLEIQKNLYNEVLEESTDLQKLFSYAEGVNKYKKQIEKQIGLVFANIPETYTRPYMICSLYHLSLNYSISDYLACRKKYNHMHTKHEKHFKADKLNNDNIYQDENVFIIFSGQRPESGKITFCSKSMRDLSGKDPQYYIGRSAAFIPPPSLRSFYDKFFQNLAERADKSLIGRLIRGQVHHKEGFMTPVDFYANIHPFMTQGYYLDMIMRPVPETKEYILIHENGDIECGTKKVARRLDILRPETHDPTPFVNIRAVSVELKLVNDAFSLVDAYRKGKVRKDEFKKTDTNLSAVSKLNSSITGYGSQLSPGESKKIDMSIEKAEELYELYTTTGKDLMLACLPSVGYSQSYSYHCTVESKFYGPAHFKMITLEEIEDLEFGNEYEEQDVSMHLKDGSEMLRVPKDKIGKSEEYNTSDVEEIPNKSGDFTYEDEKHNEDLPNFKTVDNPLLSPTVAVETMEEPLNSPLSGTFMLTPKDPLIQQKTSKFQPMHGKLSKSTLGEEEAVHKIDHAAKALVAEGSIAASQKSKTVQQKKVSSAFRLALSVKSSPAAFKIMSVIFYSALIVVFVTQLLLKIGLDRAVVELKVGKDIVAGAEERSYTLSNDMLMSRLVWDIGTARIDVTGLGAFNYPAPMYGGFLQGDANYMSGVNHYMFSNSSFLDDDARARLFASDIRIFRSPEDRAINKYTSLDNFQAIDMILSTALQINSIVQAHPVEDAQEQLLFMLENTVNDIYVKNEAISDNFMSYFEESQEGIDTTVTAIVVGTSMLFVIILVILLAIIWKQYRNEKFNLSAIAQLNQLGMFTSLDQINRFRKALENERSMANREGSMSMVDRRSLRELSYKKRDKKERSKAPNHRGIQMKYVFFTGRLLVLVALFIALNVASAISENNSISFFQKKQAQLYFTHRLRSHVTLVGVVTQELFAGNGTTLNHNEPTAKLIGPLIDYLVTLKNRVATTYMRDDYTYSPNISDILFVDGCSYIDDSTWQYFCFNMENHGKKTGLIYLLGDMENLAENKMIKFESMNRSTTEALATAQVEDFEEIVVDYFAIAEQCKTIAKIFDDDFEDELEGSKSERDNIFLIFSLLLAFVGLLSWFFIFLSLKNYHQQFKRLLQAFPATLILSSFTLKTFLIKTSKGALDFVKNEI